ncbi:hypothetical protein [Enterococcus gallinarum]|uniref:hypothetical protein n=1 Tax=Enterococcus gallinarum TaxID=1353 RepID=UPI003D6AFDA2
MIKLIRLLITFLLLIETNFFGIIKIPEIIYNVIGYKTKYLLLFFSFLLFFFYVIAGKPASKKKANFKFAIYFLILSTLVITLLSMGIYRENILYSFKMSYYYLIPISYLFFSVYFSDETVLRKFINTFVFIGTLYSLIIILQVFVYKYLGIVFLNFHEKGIGEFVVRSYGIRIARPESYIVFSYILLLIRVYMRYGNKILNYVYICIHLFYIFTISMTRVSMIMCGILGLFLCYMLIKDKSRLISYLLVFLIIVLVITFGSELVLQLLYGEESRISSLMIRLNEVSFYASQFFNNIFFGRGFPSDNNYYYLNHGPEGKFFITDVGVLGFLSIYGLIGIIFVMITSFKIFNLWKNTKKDTANKNVIFILILYLVMSLPTLFVLDPQRVIILPIILAFIDFYSDRENERNIK